MEWPSDIFNPLYAKEVFPFSASHRNVSVGKFRHSLLIWLRFSYAHYITLPSFLFLTKVSHRLFCVAK